jgi:enoyl-CoA hydratase/carnithine racemase
MGLAWKVCEPDDLMGEVTKHAEILASRSISSLMAVKSTLVEPTRDELAAALEREYAQFAVLMGGAANADALAEFSDRRKASD